MKSIPKKELIVLAGLFFLALGLRLVYLGQQRGIPLFDRPIVDAEYHDRWAVAISQGAAFQEGPYFRAPLYPYFLALIYAVFGHSYLAVRLVQFVMGSGSVLFIYLLGRKVFGKAVGILAGAMAAAYGTMIYFDGELLMPVLILFLDLALVLAALFAADRPSWRRWLVCGLLLGLSAVARPNVLVFGAALLVWIAAKLTRGGQRPKRILAWISALAIGVMVVIAPVTIRNLLVGKDFVPIASQGGMNFYIGNNPQSDGVTAILPGARDDFWGGHQDAIRLAEDELGRPLKASQVSNYWFRKGLEFWLEHPGAALRLTLRKVALFWSGAEMANNQDIYFVRQRIPLLGILIRPGPLYVPFGIVAPLALAGMVLAWRHRASGGAGLLALFVFSYMASVVPFFITARFRLPVIPFLLPFVAYSVMYLLRQRPSKGMILPGALILALGLVVNLNLAGYPMPPLSTSYTSMGHLYLEKGLFDRAAEEFRQALALEGRHARLTSPRFHALTGLARVYAQTGRMDQAVGMLEDAKSRWPRTAGLHFQLGHLYYAQGKLDQAIAYWQEAVKLDPQFRQAYLELGIAYEDRGQFERAVDAYQQAIRIDPRYAMARYNLGLLYARLGQLPEAVQQHQETIKIDPQFADAYAALAWIFAREGVRLDEGLELAGKALRLNPNNSWYWDVLAEVHIGRGELGKAREIFQRLIQQEPEREHWRERLGAVGG